MSLWQTVVVILLLALIVVVMFAMAADTLRFGEGTE